MMLKYELRVMLNIQGEPKVDTKKIDTNYCNNVLEKAYKHEEMYLLIKEVTSKIDSLGFDINDRDIGKSKNFKDSCINIYSLKPEDV